MDLLHGIPSPSQGVNLSIEFNYTPPKLPSPAMKDRFSTKIFANRKSVIENTSSSVTIENNFTVTSFVSPPLFLSCFRSAYNDIPNGFPLRYLFACVSVPNILKLLSCIVNDSRYIYIYIYIIIIIIIIIVIIYIYIIILHYI